MAQLVLPKAPNAGRPYKADICRQYERYTTGNTYQHAMNETQVNIHVVRLVGTDTPAVVQAYVPLWLRACVKRDNAMFFAARS